MIFGVLFLFFFFVLSVVLALLKFVAKVSTKVVLGVLKTTLVVGIPAVFVLGLILML